MADVEIEWPWQYSFPPFFTLQKQAETRSKQVAAWRSLILEYFKKANQSVVDVREAINLPLFNNAAINRKLDTSSITVLFEELHKMGHAAPLDKHKHRWEIYWHTLEEWAQMVYSYVNNAGATNTVMTLFELTQGEDVQGEPFANLNTDVMIKVLRKLEEQKKCELILSDDIQGVKFF